MNRINRNRGFTLVEILIAMVIFAITMLTLFSAFSAFVSSSDFVTSEISRSKRFRFGLGVMNDDLKQVFLVQYPRYVRPEFDSDPDPYRFVGSLSDVDADRFSELTFTSTRHISFGPFGRSGVARITYYVHSHDGRTDLHRSDRLPPFGDEKNPCTDPVLFRDIIGFKLSYAGDDGEETDTWDSESEGRDYRFPVRVTIQVSARSGDSEFTQETAILLPVNREASE